LEQLQLLYLLFQRISGRIRNKKFFFIKTDEEDIKDIKDRLGKKLNKTPLKREFWR